MVHNEVSLKETTMALRKKHLRHTAEENERRLAAISEDLAQQRRERSIASKERALDFLEQSNRRVRWLAAKTRALEVLADTAPARIHARESRERAEAVLTRTAHVSRVAKTLAAESRWIANQVSRQRRERRSRP
jgi:hypothetical protein